MSYTSLDSRHYWRLIRVFGRVHKTCKGKESEKKKFLFSLVHCAKNSKKPLIMPVFQACYPCGVENGSS